MTRRKHHARSISILPCAALACWAGLAEAATVDVYLTDSEIDPHKIEVVHGDEIVFHNDSRTKHLVEVTGRTGWFGHKNFVHELPVYRGGARVLLVDGKTLKPGSYNIECAVHKRMRGTIVVHATGSEPKALREGEHWSTKR